MSEAYPLSWPDGWPRTPTIDRKSCSSTFSRPQKHGGLWTFAEARDALQDELGRHDANGGVLSTNFDVGRNGPMEGRGWRPADQGVAIFFQRQGKPYVMASDRYHEAEGNMRSLCLALEAMRQLERHGGGMMLERAFAGFTALPPPVTPSGPIQRPWRVVLGFSDRFGFPSVDCTPEEAADAVRNRYRRQAATLGDGHPDLLELNLARDAALKEILT